jgi:serine/threonine-protein kinase
VEFVEPSLAGQTLRYRLRAGQVPAEEADRILHAVCTAFIYAAERKPDMVHGDVRPENVMMTREDRVKVTDFGMVISLTDPAAIDIGGLAPDVPVSTGITLSEGGIPLCAVPYVAPERLSPGAAPSLLSDIYSFGCLAFEVLTGRWPFEAATVPEMLRAHQQAEPQRAPLEETGVSAAVAGAVVRCLAKDPGARPQSFAEVMGLLSGVESPTSVPAPMVGGIEAAAPELSAPDVAAAEPVESLAREAVEPEAAAEELADRALESAPYPEAAAAEPPAAMDVAPGEMEAVPAAPLVEEEAAAPQAEGAATEPSLSIEELVELGVHAARSGRLDEAVSFWENALREDWRTPSAHANLGAALAAKGESRRAHTHLREAVRLDPRRPQAHFNLGRLYHDEGEFEKAVDAYRAAVDLDPNYGVAYVALGATLEALGRSDEAAAAYAAAVERCDDRRAKERLEALRSRGAGQ